MAIRIELLWSSDVNISLNNRNEWMTNGFLLMHNIVTFIYEGILTSIFPNPSENAINPKINH